MPNAQRDPLLWAGNDEAGDLTQPRAFGMAHSAAESATEIGADFPEDDAEALLRQRRTRFARVVALAVVGTVIFSLLAGCGGGSDDGAATEDQADTVQRPGVQPPQCSQPKACA